MLKIDRAYINRAIYDATSFTTRDLEEQMIGGIMSAELAGKSIRDSEAARRADLMQVHRSAVGDMITGEQATKSIVKIETERQKTIIRLSGPEGTPL